MDQTSASAGSTGPSEFSDPTDPTCPTPRVDEAGGWPGQTTLLRFTNPEEFLAELRERGPNVDGTLRLTFRWQADTEGLPISDLWVVANYLRRLDPETLAVVRLDHYVGGVRIDFRDPADDPKRERADRVRTRIRDEALRLGLEVRAGTHANPGSEGGRR